MTRFGVLLPRAGPQSIVDPTGPGASRPGAGEAARDGSVRFEDILEGQLGGRSVKVSAHAQERLRTRGITLDAVDLDRIARAMDLAARKGGRESLLVGEKAVFVVSVPNRTVITAMGRGAPGELTDSVFTQIDSAVMMD